MDDMGKVAGPHNELNTFNMLVAKTGETWPKPMISDQAVPFLFKMTPKGRRHDLNGQGVLKPVSSRCGKMGKARMNLDNLLEFFGNKF